MDSFCHETQSSFAKGIMVVYPTPSLITEPPRRPSKFRSGSRFVTNSVRSLGVHAALYCGTCAVIVAFEKAITGQVKDWPYCPVHQQKPLMVRPVSP